MDFIFLFRVLFKRKWIIIGSAIIAGAIAWYFTRNEPKNYRASARVATGFAVPDEIKVNETFTLFDAEVKFNNAITTWTSPAVVSLLSYELILHDLNSKSPFRSIPKEQLQSKYKDSEVAEAKRVFQEKLSTMSVLTSYKADEKKLLELLTLYGYGYAALSQTINIYQVPRTDYIQLDAMTENPELSAFIVNNIYQQFIRYYRGIRSSKSQQAVDTLEALMNRKKQELDEKNRVLRGEGIVDATTENTSKFQLISELEQTLAAEKNKRTDDYYALRKINQKLAALGPAPNSSANNNNSNSEELVIARKAMNEAYAEYLKTNDKAQLDKYNSLKAEYNIKYANSKGTTEKTGGDTRSTFEDQKNDINVDIDASNAKIADLESKISQLKQNVSAVSTKGANVESLIEEVKLTEREYLDAKQKFNTALDMSSSAVTNFRQLQIAQPAIEPEPSKRKQIIGMAAIAAFLSSILIIVLLTYLDSSIKTPVIFSKTVNLKLISMVNFMNLKKKRLRELVAGETVEADYLENKRNNVFRESIRKLRFEIETSGKHVFLFTSTKKGEGKTTLIQALSYSMSLSNKKILIIDTNFCNNDLTVQLDAEPILEKLSIENKNGSLAEHIKNLSKDIGVGSVFVIGSEGGDYTPSEILPRENILGKLHTLIPTFDYIFLEGPPLNDFTDSKELLQYVDGVVAIFSATHIVKQIDKESITFFKELDGKFIGSVLNMVDLKNVNVI